MSSDGGATPISSPAVAGVVAIVGRPNVGKSTLLNRLLGQKLAIVSPKPQTTRNRIAGVWNGTAADRSGQIVFVDTPGVHEPHGPLSRFMVDEALDVLSEADAILFVVDGGARGEAPVDAEALILERLADRAAPVILAVNKVDTVADKARLLPRLDAWSRRRVFAALIPISALHGDGVPALVEELLRVLPEGPPLYDPDTITDRSERFLAAEFIREQVFLSLRQEVPYAAAVAIDAWEDRPQNDTVITATIVVEREGQKAIVVGRGGAMIREIGRAARAAIGEVLGRPAHLRLQVKVDPDWSRSAPALARLGYRAEG